MENKKMTKNSPRRIKFRELITIIKNRFDLVNLLSSKSKKNLKNKRYKNNCKVAEEINAFE